VAIHYYRSCAKNIAYGIYGRHFAQRTRPDPAVVNAMKKRTIQWIEDELVPALTISREKDPEAFKIRHRQFIEHRVLPAKRQTYL